MIQDASLIGSVIEIIFVNLLLSGDNAVVIAMACRTLPHRQRRLGILLGAGAAVVMRIGFTFAITQILGIPFLKLAGGLLLLWIAVKLLTDETGEADIAAGRSVWSAVRTIAIADAVMSLDNVVAIAAAAKGQMELIIFGLALSIPLVVAGASLLADLIQRYNGLVWGGAALLGWIAGDILSDDPEVIAALGRHAQAFDKWAPVIFAVAVVLTAYWKLKRREPRGGAQSDG